jgi:hypothetical protein
VADTFAEYRANLLDNAERYRHSSGESAYEQDAGILVIPVMGPAGTAPVQVRVHAPVGYRTVRYKAAASKTPPLLPAPADTDGGDTLLTADITMPTPAPQEDGTLLFGAACEYTYVQPGGGRGTEDTFPLGKHPFLTLMDAIATLPPPRGGLQENVDWHWNTPDYDMRLLGTYDLFT